MIITFANQKGGVGKTTLCLLFANYLSKRGENVLVMDLDRQRSILSKRKADESAFTDQEEGYNVEECDIENLDHAQKLMEEAKKIDGYILLDTPGNVTEDGLIPIFKDADVIICPFKYEKLCLESTGIFIQVLLKLKERHGSMNPKMFYVPNHIDARIGTGEEKELWAETDEVFRQFGHVTPIVAYKSSLMRTNTYTLSIQQEIEIKPCFDYILENI